MYTAIYLGNYHSIFLKKMSIRLLTREMMIPAAWSGIARRPITRQRGFVRHGNFCREYLLKMVHVHS